MSGWAGLRPRVSAAQLRDVSGLWSVLCMDTSGSKFKFQQFFGGSSLPGVSVVCKNQVKIHSHICALAYIMRYHVPGTASSHVSKPTISKVRRQTASCQFPSQGSSQYDRVCLLINMLFCAELLPMSNGSYLQQLEWCLAYMRHLYIWLIKQRRNKWLQEISCAELQIGL